MPYCLASRGDMYLSRSVSSSICTHQGKQVQNKSGPGQQWHHSEKCHGNVSDIISCGDKITLPSRFLTVIQMLGGASRYPFLTDGVHERVVFIVSLTTSISHLASVFHHLIGNHILCVSAFLCMGTVNEYESNPYQPCSRTMHDKNIYLGSGLYHVRLSTHFCAASCEVFL